MPMSMPRPNPGTCALAAALLCAPAAAQTEIDRRFDAAPDGTVEIRNVAGSITAVGWDRDQVEVTGVLGRGVEGLDVSSRDGNVRIEVGRGGRSAHGGSAELEVRLPRASRLAVESVSAEVRVSGVDGDLDLESVSGSLTVGGRPRTIEAETISGSVEIDGAVSRITARSVNGTILVRGGAEIAAETVSGEIRLLGLEAVRRAELQVVSGRIEFEGGLAKGADLDISSHNGSVVVTLPSSVSARFEVVSFGGRIDNELGPPARRQRFSSALELDFTAGSGEARVRIESFTGGVTLRKR